jgi:hypothetical protein
VPRRNTRKAPQGNTLYHVYNRERDRLPMFIDDQDRLTFTRMITRYLTEQPSFDSRGRPYRSLRDAVRLESLALETTHYHSAMYQLIPGGIEALMNGAVTGYVRYFHRRHGGEGAMFRGEYRCAPRLDRYGQKTLFAYIHDNHGADCHCRFCTHRYFLDPTDAPNWLHTERALALFGGSEGYQQFRAARSLIKGP